jgi:hypothetical protein
MNYIISEQQINTLLKRDFSDKQQMLVNMVKTYGADTVIKLIGGVENYVKILYDGDFDKFFENYHDTVKISNDGLSMYFSPFLVEILPLDDLSFSEKKLGTFSFGPKDGLKFAFNARLYPVKQGGEIKRYKVVGTSGDSGFGYGYISKKNTLGKRYRQQIFKQILDKYNLNKYVKL